ncbi:uncharacterized protein LOC143280830 [Babylonia areolata]|uniref:uncharacterized protein LOC143280830 n=1 Tax=Babylonia areolata TaxID=304850 RepID=UPI003FD177F6
MATQSVLVHTNDHSRIQTPVRGRGRARPRKNVDSDSASASTHNVTLSQTKAEEHRDTERVDVKEGQFEDVERRRPLTGSPHGVKHSPRTSTPLKEKATTTTSDKENSYSPKPQRSRKAFFDSGVMSQINKHLRQGTKERFEANVTRSLDRVSKEVSPGVRAKDMGPTHLKVRIPGSSVPSSVRRVVAPHTELLAEGRPRSMTDPASPPSAEDRKGGQAHTMSPHLLCLSQPAQSPESSNSSVPSLSSPARSRGRGRARGRARSTHSQDMDVHPKPAAASSHNGSCDDLSSKLHAKNMADTNSEQFSDAVDDMSSLSLSNCHVKTGGASACGSGGGGGSSVNSNPRPAGESSSSRPGAADERCPQLENVDTGRHSKGLTLKIGADEPGPDTMDPALYSPDDITLLLSPNHEYTLDWAAAMATPPPQDDQSAPDWNVQEQH